MFKILKSITLTKFDIFFLVSYCLLWVWFIITSQSYLVAGGILLIIGAWLVYKGEIFLSIFMYLIADTMWVVNAYINNDIMGVFFILAGMFFGVLATFKMQLGQMAKKLESFK